jgi:hypothetical protein
LVRNAVLAFVLGIRADLNESCARFVESVPPPQDGLERGLPGAFGG